MMDFRKASAEQHRRDVWEVVRNEQRVLYYPDWQVLGLLERP